MGFFSSILVKKGIGLIGGLIKRKRARKQADQQRNEQAKLRAHELELVRQQNTAKRDSLSALNNTNKNLPYIIGGGVGALALILTMIKKK